MNHHVLVISPLRRELSFLAEGLKNLNWDFQNFKSPRLPFLQSKSPRLTLAVGGHGKVQFGIQTQYYISYFGDITHVICVGAGGGLVDQVKVGDLVLGEKTVEHDYREKYNSSAKLPEFLGHPDLILALDKISHKLNFSVHRGVIASGDEDIIELERAKELHRNTRALAVAWEGVGGARACALNKIPYIEIRAITDNAMGSVAESFNKNLKQCMINAAELIHRFHSNDES